MKRMIFGAGSLAIALSISTALVPSPVLAQQTSLTLGAAAADVGNLDPHFATSTSDRTLVAWIYGALVRFAPGTTSPAEIEPDLAESWEASEDNLVWTFTLRDGVAWHGGYGDVTAEDVVFSLEKAANPDTSAFSADYAAFESVEAVDPRTVRITLSHAVPSLLGLVTNYSGGFIVPQAAFEERGADFSRSPIGFGPFEVRSIEAGVAINLAAHEGYFRGAPQIETITYRFLPTGSARDLAFQAGEIDAAAGTADRSWLTRMEANPGTIVDVFDPSELTLLHIDANKAPFDDIRVRQAVAHAINRDELAAFRGERFTRPGQSVVPANNLGFTPDAGVLPHDAERARALLAEAGYPDGVAIEMVSSQHPTLDTQAQLLQAQLETAGIRLTLNPVEHATWHQMIRQDLNALTNYGAARFPVADIYLTQFFHSDSIVGKPTAVTNFSHCDVADAAIEAARVEADADAQIAYWEEAQRLILEEICAVPLTETAQVWVRKDTLDWGFDLVGSMSLGPLITEETRFTE